MTIIFSKISCFHPAHRKRPVRGLPVQPHLDVPKQQARELLRQCKAKITGAFDRVRRQHPRFHTAENDSICNRMKLSDAQWVIAREYGFASWTKLKQRITGNTVAQLIDKAIRSSDAKGVTRLLTAYPDLAHVPVRSGKWGPPMSYAVNMGLPPLAKVLGTYGRHPIGKHAILQRFIARGYRCPDTPMMAFHCGDLERLKTHLQRDRQLIFARDCMAKSGSLLTFTQMSD